MENKTGEINRYKRVLTGRITIEDLEFLYDKEGIYGYYFQDPEWEKDTEFKKFLQRILHDLKNIIG